MHRRTALTVTGALALTLAAGSAAMAANLGILDRGSGVNVGDLSPVDNTTQVSTPGTTDDSIPGVTSSVPGTTPTSIDDQGADDHGGVAGHDDGLPGDADDDGVVNTVPTTPEPAPPRRRSTITAVTWIAAVPAGRRRERRSQRSRPRGRRQ
jgi:hypothetical protein